MPWFGKFDYGVHAVIQFAKPVYAHRIRLAKSITIQRSHTVLELNCVSIVSMVRCQKYVQIFTFVDAGGNDWQGIDWGAGLVEYVRLVKPYAKLKSL